MTPYPYKDLKYCGKKFVYVSTNVREHFPFLDLITSKMHSPKKKYGTM